MFKNLVRKLFNTSLQLKDTNIHTLDILIQRNYNRYRFLILLYNLK